MSISYQPFNDSHAPGVCELQNEWTDTFGIVPETPEEIDSCKNEYFHVALDGKNGICNC